MTAALAVLVYLTAGVALARCFKSGWFVLFWAPVVAVTTVMAAILGIISAVVGLCRLAAGTKAYCPICGSRSIWHLGCPPREYI